MSLDHSKAIVVSLQGERVTLLRQRADFAPGLGLDSISRTAGLRVVVAMPILEGDRVWGAVVASRIPEGRSRSLHRIRWHLPLGPYIIYSDGEHIWRYPGKHKVEFPDAVVTAQG